MSTREGAAPGADHIRSLRLRHGAWETPKLGTQITGQFRQRCLAGGSTTSNATRLALFRDLVLNCESGPSPRLLSNIRHDVVGPVADLGILSARGPQAPPLRTSAENGTSASMLDDSSHHEKIRLPLPGGGSIVLVNMLAQSGSFDDVNRNVYRISGEGAVVWQIETRAREGERLPYTNIYFDGDGRLRAYCWDGGEYPVDPDTGSIGQGVLIK